jgi:hypothetical protein
VGLTLSALGAAGEAEGRRPTDPYSQFASMLARDLELLGSEPAVARTFLVEVYGAGPDAVHRRLEVHERFVAALEGLLGAGRRLSAADRFAIESLVGVVTFQVTVRVMAGDFRALPGLREPLLDAACRLCPWIDPERTT